MNRANRKRQVQDLRYFTVKICDVAFNKILGTGFVVSRQGKIVTCAHVVRKASETGKVAEGLEVGVYFSRATNPDSKALRATVAACFQDYDDDVVLLQLENPYLPDGIEVAILGTAEESADHPFQSFGYRRLDNYLGWPVKGEIINFVERPEGSGLQAELLNLDCKHIDFGMSGAAVLDTELDLVVGIIAQTWYSERPEKNEKNRDINLAVDSLVLTFDPIRLTVEGAMTPETPSPSPPPPKPSMTSGSNINLDNNLDNAPPPLVEWVGRKELLNDLDRDWLDPDTSIVGLIGFGGEGKSSITRRWLDELRENPELPQPKGIFWWAFYERPRVDEFFEAARKFILPETDLQPSSSASVNVQDILSRLNTGRYLFVLDGIEVLQHQEGDDYGLFSTAKLRDFLRDFAAGEHESFCLISSRAPILDLIDFKSYVHRDIERLSLDEGRELLQKLGVKGADADLDWLVEQWDGYALVLSLLGAYFVKRYRGKIKRIGEILPPTADEPKYDRVRRVLRRYDEHLSEDERQFMRVLSAFRLPIVDTELQNIYRLVTTGYEVPRFDQSKPRHLLPAPLRRLWYWLRKLLERLLGRPLKKPQRRILDPFQAMVERLKRYRILRHNTWKHYYTTHPLIAAHYRERLQDDFKEAREVHRRIKDYYLHRTVVLLKNPTLEDLLPLLEAVHHLCQAGDYDEAFDVFLKRVLQYPRRVLTNKLNAWDASLASMREFFPNEDLSQEPQTSPPSSKSWIMNHVGLCFRTYAKCPYLVLVGAIPPWLPRSKVSLRKSYV